VRGRRRGISPLNQKQVLPAIAIEINPASPTASRLNHQGPIVGPGFKGKQNTEVSVAIDQSRREQLRVSWIRLDKFIELNGWQTRNLSDRCRRHINGLILFGLFGRASRKQEED